VLQEQNTVFIENNKELTKNVTEMKDQLDKFKEIYQKLLAENEKLARIRDGLQEQLDVIIEFFCHLRSLYVYEGRILTDVKVLLTDNDCYPSFKLF